MGVDVGVVVGVGAEAWIVVVCTPSNERAAPLRVDILLGPVQHLVGEGGSEEGVVGCLGCYGSLEGVRCEVWGVGCVLLGRSKLLERFVEE